MSKFIVFLILIAFSVASLSAGTVAGKVTAKESGEALIGANVYLKGTTIGAATDEDGMYYIQVDDGNYTIVCDFVGYATITKDITVDGDTKLDFALAEYLFAQTINVIADRARERETPVAFTNVEKAQIDGAFGFT
jgi:iron complex outermembrane recepter protein